MQKNFIKVAKSYERIMQAISILVGIFTLLFANKLLLVFDINVPSIVKIIFSVFYILLLMACVKLGVNCALKQMGYKQC